ncbi:hypothetical protein HCC61_00480 [Streptomyces sp. HNM0575]|nr:hypothetical protein [Streptomyces sp. HNM0575]
MAGGGFVQLPDGSVIVALTLPVPAQRAARHAEPDTGATPDAGPEPVAEDRQPGPVRQGRRGGPHDGLMPERRSWSAHADEAHTVRAVTARRYGDEPRVRVLVHSLNRARALTRLRNLGMRAVYLRGNAEPPSADEITAVLHHPDGLVWRTSPGDDRESWHPIESLLRPSDRGVRTG